MRIDSYRLNLDMSKKVPGISSVCQRERLVLQSSRRINTHAACSPLQIETGHVTNF